MMLPAENIFVSNVTRIDFLLLHVGWCVEWNSGGFGNLPFGNLKKHGLTQPR